MPLPTTAQRDKSASALVGPQWPPQTKSISSAVPPTSMPVRAEQEPKKISMRQRRLQADAEQMTTFFADFPLIQVQAMAGQPPEHYLVDYRIRSLMRGPAGQPIFCDRHRI